MSATYNATTGTFETKGKVIELTHRVTFVLPADAPGCNEGEQIEKAFYGVLLDPLCPYKVLSDGCDYEESREWRLCAGCGEPVREFDTDEVGGKFYGECCTAKCANCGERCVADTMTGWDANDDRFCESCASQLRKDAPEHFAGSDF
jgi:hypothetical protein